MIQVITHQDKHILHREAWIRVKRLGSTYVPKFNTIYQKMKMIIIFS